MLDFAGISALQQTNFNLLLMGDGGTFMSCDLVEGSKATNGVTLKGNIETPTPPLSHSSQMP